jgi:hypothetical protein
VTLPGVTVGAVRLSLIAFNALFALQNGMDLAWLWGLMPLPAGITLADYAHRGAYPLIVTALLAGLCAGGLAAGIPDRSGARHSPHGGAVGGGRTCCWSLMRRCARSITSPPIR